MLERPLETVLGLASLDEFLDRYFLQFPFVRAAGLNDADHLSWNSLKSLCTQAGADVLLTRDGQPLGRPLREWDEVSSLLDQGHALRVRHAERSSSAHHGLATAFHRTFACPVDCHVYATASESIGLHWHYDAEDVFVLQIDGTKEWRLRKNTVNPWPLMETLPLDIQLERERTATMECILGPGDWLYIPAGYWHATRAVERSLSISVGLQPPSAIRLLDYLREHLLSDLRWRQRFRLPPDR